MRHAMLVLPVLALSRAVVAYPQSMNGVPAVDSASVARVAWGRAVAAFQSHDVATARKEVDRAATAWPTQPGYVWARARFAAIAGDTAAAITALADYADLGLGRDVRADTNLAGLRAAPPFAAIAARHDANRAPLVRSAVRGRLSDSTFWPEGMDYDPRTGRFYIASVRHRTIAELAPTGDVRELWPRHQPGIGSVLGVRVDPRRGVLWATLSGRRQMEGWTPADSTIAALIRVRIADGAIERRWDLPPVRRGHTLGDLAVGPNGDVFVTDSDDPVLYRLRPGADTLEHFTNPLFHSLQGLAPAPDGGVLYLSDYSHGFLRVDLATNAVTRVADAPRSTSLGCDGIAWADGSIIAVQNGVAPARITRFVLDRHGQGFVRAEVLDQNSGIADEPTIGAVVGGEFIYVANGQWEKYSDEGVRKPGAHLTAPVLLAVPWRGPNDMFPRWSPDGTRIGFTSDRDGDPEIYVMRADGSAPRRLTYSPGRDAHPFFSRDGSRIVFQSPRANGTDTNVYLMGSDGVGVVQLTHLTGFAGVPAYSPDEKTIVFQWRETSDFRDARKWRICVMGADGSNVRVLTPGAANDQVPTFSADGTRLLFYSDRSGKDQLYTMRPDGGDVRRVASTPFNDNAGSWSPDGTRIAFTSDRSGSVDIYVMDAEGGHVRRLTSLHATARAPVWSPDGKRILFAVDGLGPSAIFVIGANGTGLARLTGSPAPREHGVVPLTGEASVAFLDLDSARVLARIAIGPHPQDVVVSHDSLAFTLAMGSESQPGHFVVVLNVNRQRVERSIDIAPYTRPHWAQLSSDGGTLWVACEPESVIVEVDVRRSKVGRVWRTDRPGGWMFAVTSDERKIYVAQFDAAGLTVLDRATGARRWIDLSGRPIGIALTPDGGEVWIGATGTDSIYVVSTATDTVAARFASLGREPARIVFTPRGDRAVITDSRSDSVTIYDVVSRRPLRGVYTGRGTWPKGLALSRDGSIAYVSLMRTGAVIALEIETGVVLRQVYVGASPERVAAWDATATAPRSRAGAAPASKRPSGGEE